MSKRRNRPFLAVLIALAAVLSGCAANKGPKNYNDDIKANYQKSCTAANEQKLSATEAADYCGCTYDGFVEKIRFADFKDYDEQVRQKAGDALKTATDVQNQFPQIAAVISSCIKAGPSAPTTSR